MTSRPRSTSRPSTACALFTLGLALATSGCQFFFPTPIDQAADSEAPSQAIHAVGATFEEGERIEAEIYLDGVAAGNGTLSVGRRCLAEGKLALPVEVDAGSSGLVALFGDARAKSFGLLDLDTNTPLESHWDVSFSDKRTVTELDFRPGGYRQHQTRFDSEAKPKDSVRKVDLPIEQTPHDGHSLLGYLRRWEPAPGTRGHLYVIMGRYLYRADLLFVGPEILQTSKGAVPALKIDGVATRMVEKTLAPSKRVPARAFSLWIAADDPKTPLRILVESELAKITVDFLSRDVADVAEGNAAPCEHRVDKAILGKSPPKRKPRKPGAPPPKIPKFPWQE
jgi:hypothetical protein